jgi:hypothetical protein
LFLVPAVPPGRVFFCAGPWGRLEALKIVYINREVAWRAVDARSLSSSVEVGYYAFGLAVTVGSSPQKRYLLKIPNFVFVALAPDGVY